MVVTIKELSLILHCTEKTARKKAEEIKAKYGIKDITTFHVAEFYHLRLAQIIQWQAMLSERNNSKRQEIIESMEGMECPKGKYGT